MKPYRRERMWAVGTLAIAFCWICLYCVKVSRHRILWSDEMFAWEMVTDPSWGHMLRAWKLGADGGGLGFYVLCRLWLAVFGHSTLMFREFSAVNVFAAFALMWVVLRRYYRPEIVAGCLCVVWLGSRLVLWQIVQTRFYGLLLAAAAFAFWSLAPPPRREGGRPQLAGRVALVFVANLLLVSAHPLGLGYSLSLLLAFVVVDARRGVWRPAMYAAVVGSWSILIYSLPALRASAAVGKPWFWTVKPVPLELSGFYEPTFAPDLPWIACALACAWLVWPAGRQAALRMLRARWEVLLPGFLLLLSPVALWLLSQHGTSYFVDRYMIPATLGIAVFGAEILHQLMPEGLSWRSPAPVGLATVGVLLYLAWNDAMVEYPREMILPPFDFTQALAAELPRDEPVVLVRVDVFDLMMRYQNRPDLLMYYPADWALALDPQSPKGLVSGVNEMRNWRKAGYYSEHIVDSDAFLAKVRHFAVVDGAGLPWMRKRLAGPDWRITKIGDFGSGYWAETLWQVDRVAPSEHDRDAATP